MYSHITIIFWIIRNLQLFVVGSLCKIECIYVYCSTSQYFPRETNSNKPPENKLTHIRK